MVKQIEGATPAQANSVPSVLERCRMFENSNGRNSPFPGGWRQPGSASVPVASSSTGSSAGSAGASSSQQAHRSESKTSVSLDHGADPAPQSYARSGSADVRAESSQKPQLPSRTGSLKEPQRLNHVASDSYLGTCVSAPSLHALQQSQSNGSLRTACLATAAPLSGLKHANSAGDLRSREAGLVPQLQLKHAASCSTLERANSASKLVNLHQVPSQSSSTRIDAVPASSVAQSVTSSSHKNAEISRIGNQYGQPAMPSTAAPQLTSGADASRDAPAVPSKSKSHRRSACMYPVELQSAPPSSVMHTATAPTEPIATTKVNPSAGSTAPAFTGAVSSTNPSKQRSYPKVPLFSGVQRSEPHMEIRKIPLPQKRIEDNYEISDGCDSDAEESHTRDRSDKHIPMWCTNYLEALSRQTDVDPDTIFGSKVPACLLEEIFHDDLYRQAGKNRPKRARGSSGDWRRDRLSNTEISHYKSRMGHTRAWSPTKRGERGGA